MTTAERSRPNRERADFATGLIIGTAADNVASRLQKERYRQVLEEQMAEQQRNKRKRFFRDSMKTAGRSNEDRADVATGLLIGAATDNVASRLQKERYRQVLEEQMAERRRNKKEQLLLDSMKPAERSRSNRDRADFAPGLIIGAAADNVASRLQKERYRQALEEQIAEQQRNKRQEKELELRVVDPEKEPDRIRQFAAQGRNTPNRPGMNVDSFENGRMEGCPGKPCVACPTSVDHSSALNQLSGRTVPEVGIAAGPGVPGLSTLDEEFHRSLSNTVGRAGPPRIAGVPPPMPPTLSQPHRTPYDEAYYYYYGGRNPLDPNLPHWLGMPAGPGVPGLSKLDEEVHKSLSNTVGKAGPPRVVAVPPPMPPTLSDPHRIPYDEAYYYYYGATNPLDPNLPHYGPPGRGGFQFPAVPSWPPGAALPAGLSGHSGSVCIPVLEGGAQQSSQSQIAQFRESGEHKMSPVAVGVFGESPKLTRQSTRSYREALNQQIKENNEQKRKEKEDRERYEAKIDAEMIVYDPWGRGGGGAPIKDERGKLVCDLKQMRNLNEGACHSDVGEGREAGLPFSQSDTYHQGGDPAPSQPQTEGFLFSETSPALSHDKTVSDQPTPQKLNEQDHHYKFLKQQIEENRRKKEEERVRIREEEDREEKKLAEQRAQLQQEQEEEKQKGMKKKMEQQLAQEEVMRQAKERCEKEKREKEEKERQNALQIQREREENLAQREPSPRTPALQKELGMEGTASREGQREPSLPVPALQNKLEKERTASRERQREPSPPVPALQNKLGRERAESREPQGKPSSPVPALQNNQERERTGRRDKEAAIIPDEKQAMLHQLSELRQYLLSQRRQLETDSPLPTRRRGSSKADLFDAARIKTDQKTSRRAHSGAARLARQNVRESNQLKGSEVRHVYPLPASDEGSLAIQRQDLLREQQRRIRNLIMATENNCSSRDEYPELAYGQSPPRSSLVYRGRRRNNYQHEELRPASPSDGESWSSATSRMSKRTTAHTPQRKMGLRHEPRSDQEEARHAYLHPSRDEGGPDIHQQALLREQRRRIRKLIMAEENHCSSGDGYPELVNERSPPRSSVGYGGRRRNHHNNVRS